MRPALRYPAPVPNLNPELRHQEVVRPEWIDYNGHMNVAYYVLVFDHATDVMLERLGLGEDYRVATGNTVYVLEAHLNYLHELKEDDPMRVSTELLDCDAKRVHYFHRMVHARDGFLAATTEQLLMHIDAQSGRGSAMPDSAIGMAKALLEARQGTPQPSWTGRVIGIRSGAR